MFRRRALRQLDAPEQLDEAIRLATVPGWLITAVLVVAVGGAAVWATVTTVPRTVEARGVITHTAGVSSLEATAAGLVTDVWAAPATNVAKGERLYRLAGADGSAQEVTAPWDAYVTDWQVRQGQLLQPGMSVAELVRLDTPDDRLQARVYLRSGFAPMVSVGMPVEVEVDAAPAAVFGTLRGTVTQVGARQESAESVREFTGSSADVPSLLGDGNVIAVTVALEPDADGGLHWSKAQPPFTLTALTMSTAAFTVAEERPVDWLVRR
ncbi:HlyD family efflux transporter periplasmic adaptor subunit [Parafrankia elaeagni]|uniref:HlyD family efflux transporter periplasmic adaptor subunit n=1 Tax=Parafrankia elaeagni TaxID=222534 RepID=UPI0012B5F1EA|nr:HlyD family efflux transporter periplasmic adaptor subunit [Parafrankia elaeagni]